MKVKSRMKYFSKEQTSRGDISFERIANCELFEKFEEAKM
jgi:hypothetical protein